MTLGKYPNWQFTETVASQIQKLKFRQGECVHLKHGQFVVGEVKFFEFRNRSESARRDVLDDVVAQVEILQRGSVREGISPWNMYTRHRYTVQ